MKIAGIVAGGIGQRMNKSSLPKQFLMLADKPIIVHTIDKFLLHPDIDYVIVGVHEAWLQYAEDLKDKFFKNEERLIFITGGDDRNKTILNIINASKNKCGAKDNDIIITHDAVRPFITLKIITDNIDAVIKYNVCDTVIASTDTIIQSSNNEYITDVPVRNEMYQGQTPQSFKLGEFLKVYNELSDEEKEIVTDACKLFYLKGYKVKLVDGDISNIKITYPFDYKYAQIMMEDNNSND